MAARLPCAPHHAMTDTTTADAIRKQRIRRTAWALGVLAVASYAVFLFSAMRA